MEENDLYLDLPLAPWEAALGAVLPVATPGGLVEFFKQEDYDRIIASGYNQQDMDEEQKAEAFDIF